jgi:hypothetical protein
MLTGIKSAIEKSVLDIKYEIEQLKVW